jgi:hypothetical protein
MNQSTSKISEKSLHTKFEVKPFWNSNIQKTSSNFQFPIHLSSFQNEWWSNSGTTSVAFKIQATTTASVICKLNIIKVTQGMIETKQPDLGRQSYPYALLIQAPACSYQQVTSGTVLWHSS